MTDLRTLIDISYGTDKADVDDLQFDARKWVRAIRLAKEEQDNNYDDFKVNGLSVGCGEYYRCDMLEKWIMHFFNLSEEDLK